MKKINHYAYCRVSTSSQDVSKQKFALFEYAQSKKIHFEKIFEVVSSTRKSKEDREIDELLSLLENGDELYVVKLDRIGRSTGEVLDIIDKLKSKKITLHILKENIVIDPNKTDPMTTMFLTLLSAFAQLERDFISERTKMGLELAKAKGKMLGKKKGAISKNTQFEPHKDRILELLKIGLSYEKIVKDIGTGSKSALYSYVKNRQLL
jgi:DNA invertase Pin-like site-specific DNA recombinase